MAYCFIIRGHNLYRNEVFSRLQQDAFLGLNSVIPWSIRLDDIDVHRLMQYIDKSLRIFFNVVYVDGGDAARDVIVKDSEPNIPYQEWFLDLCNTTQLRAFSTAARPVEIGTTDLFIDLQPRMDKVLLLCISANEHSRRQFLLV